MQLVFLGAEVIKVESMNRVDNARKQLSLSLPANAPVNEGQIFHQLNSGKMGITLDLTQPKAIELARKLVAVSDVMVQNMRPGVMERLGLGYEALCQVRPDLIMLSSSARGATGPERNYGGYAPNQAAVAGTSHLTGYADGPPTTLHAAPDLTNATMAVFAILTALHHRSRTGQGQHIDLSQVESLACFIGEVVLDYTMNQKTAHRAGNRDEVMAPHNCYRCRGDDKWVSIAIATDEEWRSLCQAMGNPSWAQGEKFSDALGRLRNQEELDSLIGRWTTNHTHYEVMEMLQRAGVAAAPSLSSEELLCDPHLKERAYFIELDHAAVGKYTLLAPPWKLLDTPARVPRPAPLIGQHNHYVFCDLLGLSEKEMTELVGQQVIY
jgi:benzylsuccinate CoA-transferase BbsF subunit